MLSTIVTEIINNPASIFLGSSAVAVFALRFAARPKSVSRLKQFETHTREPVEKVLP
ncbi:MAG: hypothetical protein WCX12_00495 [Candidatus Paceibacterota bacterium]